MPECTSKRCIYLLLLHRVAMGRRKETRLERYKRKHFNNKDHPGENRKTGNIDAASDCQGDTGGSQAKCRGKQSILSPDSKWCQYSIESMDGGCKNTKTYYLVMRKAELFDITTG